LNSFGLSDLTARDKAGDFPIFFSLKRTEGEEKEEEEEEEEEEERRIP